MVWIPSSVPGEVTIPRGKPVEDAVEVFHD